MAALSDDELVRELSVYAGWVSGPRRARVQDFIRTVTGNAPAPASAGEPAAPAAAKTAAKKTTAKKAAAKKTTATTTRKRAAKKA